MGTWLRRLGVSKIRGPLQRLFVRQVNHLLLFTFPISLLSTVTHWQLNMTNGALIGVPIPIQHEDVGEALQEAVEAALEEAEQNGINKRGKEATPWLLKRVGELTKGTSLASSQW